MSENSVPSNPPEEVHLSKNLMVTKADKVAGVQSASRAVRLVYQLRFGFYALLWWFLPLWGLALFVLLTAFELNGTSKETKRQVRALLEKQA